MRIGQTLRRIGAALGAVVIAGLLAAPVGSVAAADLAAAGPAVALQPQASALRWAEPPFRLPTQVTDESGVLSGGDRADIQAALDQLSAEQNIDLWVVYVDTFDDPNSAEQWAQQTFAASDLGSNQMLLAVATGGRAYAVRVGNRVGLSDAQLDEVATTEIIPALRNDDWAGAAIGAANGYRKALAGGSSVWWWVAGGLVVVGAGVYLYSRRRRRAASSEQPGQPGQPGPSGSGGAPSEPLEPLDELSARSVQTLIETDNAVRASEFELSAAESDFGGGAVAQFRAAFDSARESLTKAFEIRQRVDDDQPESEAEQRAMMQEIIARCAEASATLDAQSDRFDDLRDLRSRLPQVLAELPATIERLQARTPGAAATLQRLQQQFAPAAVATVVANIDEAGQRLQFARSSLDQARGLAPRSDPAPVSMIKANDGTASAERTLPATDHPDPAAVLAAGAAQEAVAQAGTLLDAIDRMAADLTAGVGQLSSAIAAVDVELGTVRATLDSADAGPNAAALRTQLDQIRAILAMARSPQGGADPLTALHKVEEADLALDLILASTRDAQQQEQRNRAGLGQALITSRAEVGAAEDFINTRRGAVGSQARTRLAEAKRHLANAEAGTGGAAAALSEAQQAGALAREASDLAQRDVGGFGGGWSGGSRGGGSGGLAGAVLGGIVLDAVLNSGRRGRGGGGWGGGTHGGGFGGGGFSGGGGGFGGGSSGGGGSRSGGSGRF